MRNEEHILRVSLRLRDLDLDLHLDLEVELNLDFKMYSALELELNCSVLNAYECTAHLQSCCAVSLPHRHL